MKYLFDKRATTRKFQPDDLVLQWNVRVEDKGKHKKFESLWLGPYIIHQNFGKDSYLLKNMDGEIFELPVHGQFLKPFFS